MKKMFMRYRRLLIRAAAVFRIFCDMQQLLLSVRTGRAFQV